MAVYPANLSTGWDVTLKAYMHGGYGAQVTAFGALGDGIADDTSAINTALASGAKRVVLPDGTYKTTSPLVVPDGVELVLTRGATINHTVYNQNAVTLGVGSAMDGGTITSPATWDGTNTGLAWAYAVVSVEGDGGRVTDVTLSNVPRVGIGIKNVDAVIVRGNRIVGNYPSGSWTGVETNHFGIAIEPGTGVGGNVTITGNIIGSCVQAVWGGPLDGSGALRGLTVVGNVMYAIWNHAVYAYGSGFTVTGNSFDRCQTPVALSGSYHTVTGNTCFTPTTGGSDQRDYTGISIRDAIGCVVAANTIRGNAPTGGVMIDVRALDGVVVRDNVVADNTIDVVGGTSVGIRIGAGATTCDNNTVHDNHVRTIGTANLGSITLAPSATGFGNRVHDNTVVMTGNSHAIFLSNMDGAIVHDNHVRLEFDNGSAITLGMVALTGSTRCQVHDNEFRVSASWGTNITLRAVNEIATVTLCRYSHNLYQLDPTKLAAAVPVFIQTGGALLDEALAGAPALAAAPGSIVRRTDGGASTTLYVKETAAGTTTWRAV